MPPDTPPARVKNAWRMPASAHSDGAWSGEFGATVIMLSYAIGSTNVERSSTRPMKCGLVLAAVKAWPGSASAAAPAAQRPALTASRHEATANHGSGRRSGLWANKETAHFFPFLCSTVGRFFVPTCECNDAARECPEPEVRTPLQRIRLRTSGSKGHSNHKAARVPLVLIVRMRGCGECLRTIGTGTRDAVKAGRRAGGTSGFEVARPRLDGNERGVKLVCSRASCRCDLLAEGRNAFRCRTTHQVCRFSLRPIRQIRAACRTGDGRTPSP